MHPSPGAIVEEYAEKIFFFCLRKCGGPAEAEDLAQDILLQVLTALRTSQPGNLAAYIWRIARNRYAAWAANKRKRRESDSGADCVMLTASEISIESAHLHNEAIHLLRRELAFAACDYRDILIAHYIKGRSVNEIAEALGVPRGTVLWRLHRARKKMKEGMDMARDFGTKSYKPEDVSFSATGNQSHGLPWYAVSRMAPKNILLAANNNPSTIEQLAMELGIAVPYMTEEVALLEDARLIKKVGDTYITNFFIADATCQQDILNSHKQSMAQRGAQITALFPACMDWMRKENIAPPTLSDNDLSWTTVLLLSDIILSSLDGFSINFPVAHKFESDTWGIIGFEKTERNTDDDYGVNQNGSGDNETMVWEYSLQTALRNHSRRPGYGRDAGFLGKLVREARAISTLSSTEITVWQGLTAKGIVHEKNDRPEMTIPVFTSDAKARFQKMVHAQDDFPAARGLFQQAFDDAVAILRRYANPILESQLWYCATMFSFDLRGMLTASLEKSGHLVPPADLNTSLAGVYMETYS